METSPDHPHCRCKHCSLLFRHPGATEFKSHAYTGSKEVVKSFPQMRLEEDGRRWLYLRTSGGQNAFEEAGLPMDTPLKMQIAMNDVRGCPEQLSDDHPLQVEITPAIMALLPAGRLKELSLWDFQPVAYS